jgi:hypothetical protein
MGLTAIDTSFAGVTVSVVDPAIPPKLAVIVEIPTAKDVVRPVELHKATLEFEVFHVTAFVRSCVLPSEYVPVALNCSVSPRAKLGIVGLTAMDTSVAAETERFVVVEMSPEVALIVVTPVVTGVASPEELTVATPVLDEFHDTVVVRSFVVLSA